MPERHERSQAEIETRRAFMQELIAKNELTQEKPELQGIVAAVFNNLPNPDDAWKLIHSEDFSRLVFQQVKDGNIYQFKSIDEINAEIEGMMDEQKYDYIIANLLDALAGQMWVPIYKLTGTQQRRLLEQIEIALESDERVSHVIVTNTEVGDVHETLADKLQGIRSRLV